MKIKAIFIGVLAALLVVLAAWQSPAVNAATVFLSETIDDPTLSGKRVEEIVFEPLLVNSPSEPPAELLAEWKASTSTAVNRAATFVSTSFPSYDWVFGCSAVSSAMIAAYYDNNGYPDMYTGSTNGGDMPISDMVEPYTSTYIWGQWNDGYVSYPNNPLVASHSGVDGQVGRGSIDDYWVAEGSGADDPYISNSWIPHTWGSAVGDYLKTSQSAYENVDGSTWFVNLDSPDGKMTCNDMEVYSVDIYGTIFKVMDVDGTYGRKLFFEEKGYTVTDCYNQQTANHYSNGFSLADFQAEIDSGNPILLNLYSTTYGGHSVVGYGYDGSTIYIRDTWDSNPNNHHWMTWTGAYSGSFYLKSVSVVHLTQSPLDFGKISLANGGFSLSSVTLSWESSDYADGYEYCIDTNDNGQCDSSWLSTGWSTSVSLSGLTVDIPYYWQVRATNSVGTTYADGGATAYWSFTPVDPKTNFLPLILK